MTREEAKKFLPLIQAFAEGKEVQYNLGENTWYSASAPTFAGNIEYRIKPEPKVIWLSSDWTIFETEEKAREYCGIYNEIYSKFIEVIE